MPDQPTSAKAVVEAYFQPPLGSFWRWAEAHEVIEWANGTTITYRAELADLLAGLAPGGLPPLGPVLLLLAACTDAWQDSTAEIGLLQGLLRGLPKGGPPDEELTFHLSVARSFLDIVRQLPPALRQGIAKEHLLREVLGSSDEAHLMPAQLARPLAARLRADAADTPSLAAGPPLSRLRARRDLLAFDHAARRFPTVHSLELRLRTGLDQLPAPLPEPPLPPPAPEAPPADLLAELAQDAQTAGLARLVPHLRAALHLPQPARQAGQQPLGGVADLTNRGPLDHLLLSELAQDDLSLLARLAHGEALYLRREAPPLPQPPPRVLLLDTTLQMWGLPRVAGLAAALALALPATGASQPAALAFALGGHAAQPLNLRTRPGVIAALGHLDAALHCGAALPGLLPTLPAQAEAVLITEAQAARQPGFLAQLRAAPPALRFVLTVARSGELALYELAGGRRTLLSSSQVEWEKVLFAPRPAAPHEVKELVLPAFLQQPRQPLFFPTVSFRASSAMMRYQVRRGVIGVTQHLRVLYWPHSYHGALEALPLVEEGTYHFGFSVQTPNTIYLLVTQAADSEAKIVILYIFRPWESSAERVDLSAQVPAEFNWNTVTYKNDGFILKGGYQAHFIDCQRPALQPYQQFAPPALAPPARPARSFVNPGYGVMQKLNHLSISPTGHLLLDTHELVADAENNLLLRPAPTAQPGSRAATHAGTFPLAASPRVRLRRWVWPNGSEAFVDTRGLLHLRSANASLPQVTIVLITNRTTAAWEAGGRLCGSSHFVCEWSYFRSLPNEPAPGQRESMLPVAEFYAQYIQPFINHLR